MTKTATTKKTRIKKQRLPRQAHAAAPNQRRKRSDRLPERRKKTSPSRENAPAQRRKRSVPARNPARGAAQGKRSVLDRSRGKRENDLARSGLDLSRRNARHRDRNLESGSAARQGQSRRRKPGLSLENAQALGS